MSEYLKTRIKATPSSTLSACMLSSLLGKLIREVAKAMVSQAEKMSKISASKISASGVDLTSATKLISLNKALQNPRLSQLRSETWKRLNPSTVQTIADMEEVATGRSKKRLSKDKLDQALSEISSAVRSAHHTIAEMERRSLTDHLSSLLTTRGYSVEIRNLKGMNLLRAKKGENLIVARISKAGTMEMDMAGFNPGECSKERMEIMKELERKGYQIQIDQTVVHNLKRGGALVDEVERSFQEIEDQIRRLNLAKAQHSRLRIRR